MQCLQRAEAKPEALAVTVGGCNIAELTDLSIEKLHQFLETIGIRQTADVDRGTDFKGKSVQESGFFWMWGWII